MPSLPRSKPGRRLQQTPMPIRFGSTAIATIEARRGSENATPIWPDDIAWNVGELHALIEEALAQTPRRIEVGFDPELGIPIWLSGDDGEGSLTWLVEDFHEITAEPTVFDGAWRFTEGALDGRAFGNPPTGLIVATLGEGYLAFPIDCNAAWARSTSTARRSESV